METQPYYYADSFHLHSSMVKFKWLSPQGKIVCAMAFTFQYG